MYKQEYQVVAVAEDGHLYVTRNVTGWNIFRNSCCMIAAYATPGGGILGVGTNHHLHVWNQLTGKWVFSGNNQHMIDIAMLPGGAYLCLDGNGYLLKKENLEAGKWECISKAKKMVDITTRADGSVLGVGRDDGVIYKMNSLGGNWEQIKESGVVISITVMPDGSILGVGKDNQIYSRKTLENSPWERVPNSGDVINICMLSDTSILGINKENSLCVMEDFPPDDWACHADPIKLKSLSAMSKTGFIGVGYDDVKQCWLCVTTSLGGEWHNFVIKEGLFNKAVVMQNGGILAIGKDDHHLWVSENPTMISFYPLKFTQIPSSDWMICIDVLPDGSILGVGTNHRLYTRETPTHPWVRFEKNPDYDLICAAMMPDGSLLGQTTDGRLVKANSLMSGWYVTKYSMKVIDLTYSVL